MPHLSEEQLLYILEVQLPEMLERHPEFEPRAFRAFFKIFTTKEQTAAILAEMQEFRNEFRHFAGSVEERFGQMDQRFEQVDQRFEQVDQRFDQVDQRFDQVDQRLDRMDQRFDQMDQRFDRMEHTMSDLRDWVQLVVGRFQVRAGRKLEDVVAGTLRLALNKPYLTPDQIRLRQQVVDGQGLVGRPGRRFEIDILVEGNHVVVFEVKSVCEAQDIDYLADKVALMRALHPDQEVEGVMVALGVERDAEERCREYDIALVH